MILLETGHNQQNPGAIAYNGITEYSCNKYIVSRVMLWLEYFGKKGVSFEGSAMQVTSIEQNIALRESIKNINLQPNGSRFLSIHFNNNFTGATGTECFIHPNTNQYNRRRATWMVNQVSELIGIPVRRYNNHRDYKYPTESFLKRLAILDQTKHPGILYEVSFLNKNDMDKVRGKENMLGLIFALGMMHNFRGGIPKFPKLDYSKLLPLK